MPAECDLPPHFSWFNDQVAACAHPGHTRETLDRSCEAFKRLGVQCVVSLAPIDAGRLRGYGMKAIELPIADMGVPQCAELNKAVRQTQELLREGKKIVVHCTAGFGRTGLYLACLLLYDRA